MDHPDLIHLRDYVISADIGAFQTERGSPQRIRFDLSVELAEPVLGINDEVDRILSYDVLTDAIRDSLADDRCNLLETLAERIAAQVLAHPRAARIRVTIDKLDRIPGALGITITRSAGQMDVTPEALRPVVRMQPALPPTPPQGAVVLVPGAPGLPVPQGGDQRRIALLALDQAAWALAGALGLTVADSRTELDWAAGERRPVVWAPARMLADVAGVPADPVAATLWLAERLGAARVEWSLPPTASLPALPAGLRIESRRAPA